jgi:8-oxo-dGTP pyrophosphatase MutT (NUDIX family)
MRKGADSNNDPSSVQSIVDNSISNKETVSSSSSSSSSSLDSNREAAILIPLCTVQGTPSILFTRRSATLSTHASQISFPGGYYDEELDGGIDNNEQQQRLINTALRETQEELCYNIHQLPTSSLITILGQTQPVPSMTGSKVTPIIATLNYDLPHHTTIEFNTIFPGNSDEVDWIFTVTIDELLEGEGSEVLERWSGTEYGHTVVDDKKTKQQEYDGGGGDDDVEKKRRRKKNEVMGPVFHIPECEKKRDGDKIWGLTAIVLRPLLRKVFKPVFFGNNNDDCVVVDDGSRVHNAKL